MRSAHIKVKSRIVAPGVAARGRALPRRAVAPLAWMRQPVAAAILICHKSATGRMTLAASPGIRRGPSGCFEPRDRTGRSGTASRLRCTGDLANDFGPALAGRQEKRVAAHRHQ